MTQVYIPTLFVIVDRYVIFTIYKNIGSKPQRSRIYKQFKSTTYKILLKILFNVYT